MFACFLVALPSWEIQVFLNMDNKPCTSLLVKYNLSVKQWGPLKHITWVSLPHLGEPSSQVCHTASAKSVCPSWGLWHIWIHHLTRGLAHSILWHRIDGVILRKRLSVGIGRTIFLLQWLLAFPFQETVGILRTKGQDSFLLALAVQVLELLCIPDVCVHTGYGAVWRGGDSSVKLVLFLHVCRALGLKSSGLRVRGLHPLGHRTLWFMAIGGRTVTGECTGLSAYYLSTCDITWTVWSKPGLLFTHVWRGHSEP